LTHRNEREMKKPHDTKTIKDQQWDYDAPKKGGGREQKEGTFHHSNLMQMFLIDVDGSEKTTEARKRLNRRKRRKKKGG